MSKDEAPCTVATHWRALHATNTCTSQSIHSYPKEKT